MLRHAFASPKLAALARRLQVPRYQAVGVLEHLWHFTATQAPRGDLGRWSDEEIAAAIDWERDPGQLVEALVATRWIDRCATHRLLVHDWPHHCDQTVKRSPAVRENGGFAVLSPIDERAASEPLASDARQTCGSQDSLSLSLSPEPEPEPEPAALARRSRAANSNGAAPRKQRPKKPREPKPSHHAIRIYCEEYKTAREQSGVVPPKDQKNLGQVYLDLGEDQLRAALRVFFTLEEQWIRDTSYSAGAFLGALPRCHARAQGIAASEERKRAREREDAERLAREGGSWDDIPAETQRKAASLFGGAK